jgi:hypothetical protein
MANRYNPNLIHANDSYSPREIAELFGIDKMTCLRWIKSGELRVIKKNTNPLLVMGNTLKEFIANKLQKRKIPLAENEFFCLSCRKAVIGKNGSVKILNTGKRVGKEKNEQLNKIAICEKCGSRVNRFVGVYQKN